MNLSIITKRAEIGLRMENCGVLGEKTLGVKRKLVEQRYFGRIGHVYSTALESPELRVENVFVAQIIETQRTAENTDQPHVGVGRAGIYR